MNVIIVSWGQSERADTDAMVSDSVDQQMVVHFLELESKEGGTGAQKFGGQEKEQDEFCFNHILFELPWSHPPGGAQGDSWLYKCVTQEEAVQQINFVDTLFFS